MEFDSNSKHRNTSGEGIKLTPEYAAVDVWLSNGEFTGVYATQVCVDCAYEIFNAVDKEDLLQKLKQNLLQAINEANEKRNPLKEDLYGPRHLFENEKEKPIQLVNVEDLTIELQENGIL